MIKPKFKFLGLMMAFSAAFSVEAQETLLLRSPSMSTDKISFVYGGDIWISDKSGANPRRLTTNPGVEQNPIFSPDGKQIAFTGNYDGNTDVYVMPIEGGEPKRVTFHPSSDVLRGWLNNNEVYYTTTREFNYALSPRLYSSSITGLTLDKSLPMPEAFQGSPSKDGRYWAYIKNTDPTERDRVAFKRYRGGGMPSIWIFDTKTSQIETIPGERCNDVKPVWLGNKIYFLSDRNKIVNIYSYDIKSKKVDKLTNFTDYDVRTLNGTGSELIFEQAGKVHIFNINSKSSSALAINVSGDALYKRPHYDNMRDDIRSLAISPSGQRALLEARGEIFSVPKEKGEARNISNSPGAHDKFPSWSPNGKWISYISSQTGKYVLQLRDQFGKDEPMTYSLGESNFYFEPTWSPDSKKLFYNDSHLNLFYIDIDTKKIVKVDTDLESGQTGRVSNHFEPSWSPDSKWISYIKTLPNTVSAMFLYNVDTKESKQITDGMSAIRSTAFSRDGKYLFFTASTNVGLTNSGLHMSATERRANFSAYAFILSSKNPSFIKNESDEETIKEDKLETEKPKEVAKSDKKEKGSKKEESKKEAEKETVKPIAVDFDNISNRIVALPIGDGVYGINGTVANQLTYVKNGTLYAYDFTDLKEKDLVAGVRSYDISADGKKMIVQTSAGISIVPAGQKVATPTTGQLKLDNIKQLVDPVAEWKQIFDEVWAMQKDYFYVENMHGADWNAVKTKYEKFLPYVSHRSDLGYLLNEMMGEMVVGHSYIYPGDQPTTPSVSVGVLGADYSIDKGFYKIDKIFTRLDWNPSFNAPLAEPGLDVKSGMYLVAVDGVALTADMNLYSLFDNTVGKQITIKINTKPSLIGAKEYVVKPISFSDEMNLRSTEWTERNRKRVEELSKGQIAYIYMPNTGAEGYTAFNRYYFSQMDKKALLLDERNNGGGWVADYVIDLLSRDLIAGWGIRDGKGFNTPGNGIYGPKAMIINENAGSGGDMMPYMFRFKGLGKLVGRTTMGILVGISGYPPLLDGGRVTSPNFGVYDLKGNYIIENEGVAPDVFIEQTPKDLLEGRDPQLEKTVQILLDEMKTYPYQNMKKPADPIRVN
ncbi:PDZ domain-containing protein [Sphingobacterium sp. SRCM116780]|uniref:S41 family peptidase n=1 Tax=Sphingobacterium sp. SRCM116780 TaxID=2907623 RepID=UPI001F459049|nr:S41 family peptidase [Sphingobacterium sp. SRCM116780]UIR55756.1 PDZ domain-containing protein [Sphingobacterium sp. SRCM116780]